jgi:hypothetical protein
VVFANSLWLALGTTPDIAKALPATAGEANVFRVICFILTFFSIGVLSDFRKLWQQGFGKLAAVYFVSRFGFVILVGLLISWLFFSGVKTAARLASMSPLNTELLASSPVLNSKYRTL